MKKKFRSTPARKALMEVFANKAKPLSAQKISTALSAIDISVNKTTIYRELNFMLKKGFIREVIINSGKKYYESTFLKHHHHLICTDCWTIEDVYLKNDLDEEEKRIADENGFKSVNHSLEFFGLCQNCQ